MISSIPIQYEDTPIQKIVIRPSSQPDQFPLNHSTESSSRSGKEKFQSSSTSPVIRVLTKSPANLLPSHHRSREFHLNALLQSSDGYPIYYTYAKTNGRFRSHRIRALKLE